MSHSVKAAKVNVLATSFEVLVEGKEGVTMNPVDASFIDKKLVLPFTGPVRFFGKDKSFPRVLEFGLVCTNAWSL